MVDTQAWLFWMDACEDVLWQARALDNGHTDLGEVARFQGFGQWWAVFEYWCWAPSRMWHGYDTDIVDPNGAIGCTSPTPDLAGTREGLEAFLRVAIASQDLNPASLLRSTAITPRARRSSY
ncbi:MAG: hypothetical protein U1F43_26270 [Myxococcota bacterium]